MIWNNMKMRTASISPSFKTATSDGANVILLVPLKTKRLMRRAQRVDPPLRYMDGDGCNTGMGKGFDSWKRFSIESPSNTVATKGPISSQ